MIYSKSPRSRGCVCLKWEYVYTYIYIYFSFFFLVDCDGCAQSTASACLQDFIPYLWRILSATCGTKSNRNSWKHSYYYYFFLYIFYFFSFAFCKCHTNENEKSSVGEKSFCPNDSLLSAGNFRGCATLLLLHSIKVIVLVLDLMFSRRLLVHVFFSSFPYSKCSTIHTEKCRSRYTSMMMCLWCTVQLRVYIMITIFGGKKKTPDAE